MDRPLTVVIPVYNEGANFPALWSEITASFDFPFNALVSYDFDEDDTLPVARQLLAEGETRLRLVKNGYGRGVVGAIRSGFDNAPPGPVLVVMADLSDDLRQVPAMLEHYRQGSHLVVGSRYMKGGRLIGGPWFKQLLNIGLFNKLVRRIKRLYKRFINTNISDRPSTQIDHGIGYTINIPFQYKSEKSSRSIPKVVNEPTPCIAPHTPPDSNKTWLENGCLEVSPQCRTCRLV